MELESNVLDSLSFPSCYCRIWINSLSLFPSLYHWVMYVLQRTSVEQVLQEIKGRRNGVCWHIEHWKTTSKNDMKDRLNMCLKVSWWSFEISFFTSVISSNCLINFLKLIQSFHWLHHYLLFLVCILLQLDSPFLSLYLIIWNCK